MCDGQSKRDEANGRFDEVFGRSGRRSRRRWRLRSIEFRSRKSDVPFGAVSEGPKMPSVIHYWLAD